VKPTTRLRQLVEGDDVVVAPGVYDGLSARLATRAGFPAIYATGGGIARSMGYPDLGLLSPREIVDRLANIVEQADVPVIADADTGYGNALNVRRAVREFERAGVAAFHLEDQTFPKRCGHYDDKAVVPTGEMVQKLRAARDALADPDLVLIARTDALAVEGLESAIARGQAYAEAGADVIFVEAPETEDEIHRVAREIAAPLLMNQVPGGRTPMVKTAELERLGFKIVIHPTVCMEAALPAMEGALRRLQDTGTDFHEGPTLSPLDIFKKVGFDWWHAIEEKYRS